MSDGRTVTSIRIKQSLIDWVDSLARGDERSRSYMIEQILQNAYDAMQGSATDGN